MYFRRRTVTQPCQSQRKSFTASEVVSTALRLAREWERWEQGFPWLAEGHVCSHRDDEQFDIGLASATSAMDFLVCAPQFTKAELVKVDHPRADQRCLHHPQLLASFAVFAEQ